MTNQIPLVDEPYVAIDNLKRRVDYEPDDFFSDGHNPEKRFDELLGGSAFVDNPEYGSDFAGLEKEARDIINTRTGDQTFHEQTERVDTTRAPDTSTVQLPYPVQQIRTVERLQLAGSGETWIELDDRNYTSDRYHLILRSRLGSSQPNSRRGVTRGNDLRINSARRTWADISEELRITYDRGYAEIPASVRNVTVRLVNQMLRKLNMEQGIASASPEEMTTIVDASTVVTEEIEKDIRNLTPTMAKTYTV